LDLSFGRVPTSIIETHLRVCRFVAERADKVSDPLDETLLDEAFDTCVERISAWKSNEGMNRRLLMMDRSDKRHLVRLALMLLAIAIALLAIFVLPALM
jgi:hypothetical protein